MVATSFRLVLMRVDRPSSPLGMNGRCVIATLSWPAHLEADARAFIRDNLLAERLGDSFRAEAALKRGFVAARDRVAFLSERPSSLPEPPQQLAFEIDLEDLVAAFAAGLHALRTADPELDLVFEFLD